jgi:hypothetical protein
MVLKNDSPADRNNPTDKAKSKKKTAKRKWQLVFDFFLFAVCFIRWVVSISWSFL